MPRATARVLALLELLQSGAASSGAELAERLDVDERTLRRYVEHLRDLDIPVWSVRGRYGGYRLAPGYRLPPLMLTDEEALAVALGLVAGRRAGVVPASVAGSRAPPRSCAGCFRTRSAPGSTRSWRSRTSRRRRASTGSPRPASC